MCATIFLLALSIFYCCKDFCKASPISEGLHSAVVLVSLVKVACDEAEATPFVYILVLAGSHASRS